MEDTTGKQVSNLVHNEQVKLGATFFNNLGVAAFATGALIPVVNLSTIGKSNVETFVPFAIGAGIGILLRTMAYRALGALKE